MPSGHASSSGHCPAPPLMMRIWKSDLALPAKLNLFGAAVVSTMAHGFESWCLKASLLSTLRGLWWNHGWNARCLAHISDITGNSISDECRHPTYDLIATLKCKRLKWARQELTLHTQQGGRPTARGLIFDARRMLAEVGYKKGFVLCGDPAHKAVGGLLELSWGDWNKSINKLGTKTTKAAAGERGKDVDRSPLPVRTLLLPCPLPPSPPPPPQL